MILPSILSVLLIGCSGDGRRMIDYSNVDLADCSGVITLDGQPLAYAQVFFRDVERDVHSFALTDQKGRYRLMFNTYDKAGIEPGEKQVQIWTARGGAEFAGKIPAENLGRGKERVPERYNRKSELLRTVVSSKEKRAQTFNFDLESSGPISQVVETDDE